MDKWSTYLHKIYFFFVKKFRPPFFSKKYDVTISLKVTYHELQVLLILFVFSSIILSEISIKWCPGFTFHKLPKKIDENVCYLFYFKVSQRMLCNSKKQKKKKKFRLKEMLQVVLVSSPMDLLVEYLKVIRQCILDLELAK